MDVQNFGNAFFRSTNMGKQSSQWVLSQVKLVSLGRSWTIGNRYASPALNVLLDNWKRYVAGFRINSASRGRMKKHIVNPLIKGLPVYFSDSQKLSVN